jgi:hypothetical protein
MQQHQPRISPDYDQDFYAWTQHQAKLLRSLRSGPALPPEVDLDHLAEEIEDLGKAELRGVTSLIQQILMHLIKAASDPESKASNHWRSEAIAFNFDLADRYARSMRQHIDMQSLWERSLKVAEAQLQEHGASLAKSIPTECPFLLDEVMAEAFDFDTAAKRLLSAQTSGTAA